uniref:Hexosyltransferase n=1 Tax=Steinernema glaseri TaxID=37863 RepID=A0A1I7YT95_9BILA
MPSSTQNYSMLPSTRCNDCEMTTVDRKSSFWLKLFAVFIVTFAFCQYLCWFLASGGNNHRPIDAAISTRINAFFGANELQYRIGNEFESAKCDQKTLFVFVISAVNSFDERDSIRQSWANGQHLDKAVLVFIVGQPKLRIHEELLIQEERLHGDLVVTNIPDTPYSTNLKVHAGLHVYNRYCPNVPFALYTDDATVIPAERLVHMIDEAERLVHMIEEGFLGSNEKTIKCLPQEESTKGSTCLLTASLSDVILQKTSEKNSLSSEDVLFSAPLKTEFDLASLLTAAMVDRKLA